MPKITSYSDAGQNERWILAALIQDDRVLARVAPRWPDDGQGLFGSSWANVVAKWCVTYHGRYGKAPGRDLLPIYQTWADRRPDRDDVRAIDAFLKALDADSATHPPINADYLVDLAGRHFNHVRLQRLRDALDAELDVGRDDAALERVRGFDRLELGADAHVDLFNDPAAVTDAFAQPREAIVRYPGAVGVFLGNALHRSAFVAFMGPDKCGKCVAASAEVVLADGRVRTIREIVEDKDGSGVLSLDAASQRLRFGKVSQFWDNGVKPCWEVTTKTGRRVVTTSNHQYLTPDGWKWLSDVTAGDFIAVPKRIPVFGTSPMPLAELKFLAYMIADGCCVQLYATTKRGVRKKVGVSRQFTKADEAMNADFASCCAELGIGTRVSGIAHYLRKEAEPILHKHGLHGVSAAQKRIPDCVFMCPKEQLAAFLRVYFSCDGWICRKGGGWEIGASSISSKLMRQVSHLLNRFGVVHRLRSRVTKVNGRPYRSWCVGIHSREYVNLFLREINFLSRKHTPELPDGPHRSLLDRFPWQVASAFYRELEDEYADDATPAAVKVYGPGRYVREGHKFRAMFGRDKASQLRERLVTELSVTRQSFAHADPSSAAFRKYMNSDVLWDEVVSIRPVGEQATYDLGVDVWHNFVADDCIVHNSFYLLDVAWRALMQRRVVAYFEVGDLTREEAQLRFYVRAAGVPEESPDGKWPAKIPYPTAIKPPRRRGRGGRGDEDDGERDEDDLFATAEFETREFAAPIDAATARKAIQRVACRRVKSQRPYFRLSAHPAGTLSVRDLTGILDGWARGGFVPDVVVIDYADILAPPAGTARQEKRDQNNVTWMQLRALSQSRHCLVVTATQTDAAAYEKHLLDKRNFSEDKRKLAHVTGMIGLNVTGPEKERGVMRLNWIVRRRGAFSTRRVVHVAPCLALSRPCVLSAF